MNKKKLFFLIVSSLLLLFLVLLIFNRYYMFSEFLLSVNICETYYMISAVTLAAICYILDTIKHDRDAYLTFYMLPIIVIVFLAINLLVKVYAIWYLFILLVLAIIWILLNHFVLKKYLLPKINLSDKKYFWSYILWYMGVLTLMVVISFFILY